MLIEKMLVAEMLEGKIQSCSLRALNRPFLVYFQLLMGFASRLWCSSVSSHATPVFALLVTWHSLSVRLSSHGHRFMRTPVTLEQGSTSNYYDLVSTHHMCKDVFSKQDHILRFQGLGPPIFLQVENAIQLYHTLQGNHNTKALTATKHTDTAHSVVSALNVLSSRCFQ